MFISIGVVNEDKSESIKFFPNLLSSLKNLEFDFELSLIKFKLILFPIIKK